MSKIERYLPNDQYQAAMNANAPSAANPFLTEADLPSVTKYYGSFYDTTIQNPASNAIVAMKLNTNDVIGHGVSVANDLSGDPTRITVANAGVYNIQFSAQLDRTGGGGSSADVNIWVAIDGTPVDWTNTRLRMQANARYLVAAWNWFLDLSAGQYVEIIWSQNDAIFLAAEVAGVHPAIPSVIVTVNSVS